MADYRRLISYIYEYEGKQKGKNAKQKSDRFSKDQIMKQWMELFDELMSNNN